MARIQEELSKLRSSDADDIDLIKTKTAELDQMSQGDTQITDEDLVPLELFDGILAEHQHKITRQKAVR